MNGVVISIDIGTTKVCTAIGVIGKDKKLEIAGIVMSPCSGVKKGIIVDIENTANAIKTSVHQAEEMSGIRVVSAYVNITGVHINIISHKNFVNVTGDDREITSKDVDRVLHSLQDVKIPEDMQIVDIIPKQFVVDGYDEIIDPVGMIGLRLEADVDIVLGRVTSVQNIIKSMDRAGVKIDGLVVEALGTSELVLTPDEKEMGVVLVDVGGGITGVSAFVNRKLVFYDTIPVGGDHITNDISIGLKISFSEAEKIKRQYELALTSLIKNDQEITVSDISENKKKDVKISEVVEIIEARVSETLVLCAGLLEKSGTSSIIRGGIVLAGGGISYIDGNLQLAGDIFKLPARIALSATSGLIKDEYLTSIGIVKYIANCRKGRSTGTDLIGQKNRPFARSEANEGFLAETIKLAKRIFKGFF